jgi:hypothetical protein
MRQEIGVLRVNIVPYSTEESAWETQEIQDLKFCATVLAIEGDLVSAGILKDIALLLRHGHTWSEMLDDVVVRAPFVN